MKDVWNGSSRSDDLEYPDEQYQYYLCAKTFGWTINEVDEQPAFLATWLMAIAEMENEVSNERQSTRG